MYQRRADAWAALGEYASAAADLSRLAETSGGREAASAAADMRRRSSSPSVINHYAVLGVSSDADAPTIKVIFSTRFVFICSKNILKSLWITSTSTSLPLVHRHRQAMHQADHKF